MVRYTKRTDRLQVLVFTVVAAMLLAFGGAGAATPVATQPATADSQPAAGAGCVTAEHVTGLSPGAVTALGDSWAPLIVARAPRPGFGAGSSCFNKKCCIAGTCDGCVFKSCKKCDKDVCDYAGSSYCCDKDKKGFYFYYRGDSDSGRSEGLKLRRLP
jgi:hypothetical protein